MSANTYNYHRQSLRLIFRVLKEDTGFSTNPFDSIVKKAENKQSRKELKEIAETMYDVPWLGDPEGRREIEELKALGIDIRSGETAKTLCLAAVNARIRTDRLRIFTSCPHTLDEIDIYHFDPRTGKPSKQDDHCMDALAQLIWHFDGARIRKSRVHISRMPRHFSALAGDVDADEANLRVRQTLRRAKQPPAVRKAVMNAKREARQKKRKSSARPTAVKPSVSIATPKTRDSDEEQAMPRKEIYHGRKKSKVYLPR